MQGTNSERDRLTVEVCDAVAAISPAGSHLATMAAKLMGLLEEDQLRFSTPTADPEHYEGLLFTKSASANGTPPLCEKALNDAGWAFIDSYRKNMSEGMPAGLFNNTKLLLRDAITAYLGSVAPAVNEQPAGDYMKEAKRLAVHLTHAAGTGDRDAEASFLAALLAHIQRGAVLDKTARVGNGIFGAGLPTRYVIEAAQRLYEAEAERGPRTLEQIHENERIRRKTWEMFNGPLTGSEDIQRGVPEGNERDEWEAVVFTLMGHAASLYFLGQSDMPNWFYELAEKLARRHVDEALAARVREVGIQQRAALDAASDQFRDAAKMMAEPAEVPMPDAVGYVERWGGACRDCADESGVCTSSGMPCGGARKAIEYVIRALQYGVTHGYISNPIKDAALRGEVKP